MRPRPAQVMERIRPVRQALLDALLHGAARARVDGLARLEEEAEAEDAVEACRRGVRHRDEVEGALGGVAVEATAEGGFVGGVGCGGREGGGEGEGWGAEGEAGVFWGRLGYDFEGGGGGVREEEGGGGGLVGDGVAAPEEGRGFAARDVDGFGGGGDAVGGGGGVVAAAVVVFAGAAVFAGFAGQGEEPFGGDAELAAEFGVAVECAGGHGKVVELHKDVAHLFVGVLEVLDLLLERLDGIFLSVAVGALGQADLGPSPLERVRDQEVMDGRGLLASAAVSSLTSNRGRPRVRFFSSSSPWWSSFFWGAGGWGLARFLGPSWLASEVRTGSPFLDARVGPE